MTSTITVFHGTSMDWDPKRPGNDQVFCFDNPPYMQGFWVSTDLAEAKSFLTGENDRVHVYEMDITTAVPCDEAEMESLGRGRP